MALTTGQRQALEAIGVTTAFLQLMAASLDEQVIRFPGVHISRHEVKGWLEAKARQEEKQLEKIMRLTRTAAFAAIAAATIALVCLMLLVFQR
jgi:hypothetical protein